MSENNSPEKMFVLPESLLENMLVLLRTRPTLVSDEEVKAVFDRINQEALPVTASQVKQPEEAEPVKRGRGRPKKAN